MTNRRCEKRHTDIEKAFVRALTTLLVLGCRFAVPLSATELPRQDVFFVENAGQWDAPFAFKLDMGGAIYYVTQTGMTMDYREYERAPVSANRQSPFEDRFKHEPTSVRGHVLRMNFVDANPHVNIRGADKLASYSNYFIGRDSCKWRSRVGHFQSVIVENVWRGIDVEYRARQQGLETVYHVKPEADVTQIQIEYEGLDSPLRVDADGDLVLTTSLGEVREKAPFAYQIIGNQQVRVPIHFRLLGGDLCRLDCEPFDSTHELVIDPLIYSTYFGGGNGIVAMSLGSENSVVVTGTTSFAEFPLSSGPYQDHLSGPSDCFISKLSNGGQTLIFSTFLGGSNEESSQALLVDRTGAVYVGGITNSIDLPIAGIAFDTILSGAYDGFLSRVSASGTILEYSSLIGGTGNDALYCLGLDSTTSDVYLCGETASRSRADSFPLSQDAMYDHSAGSPTFISIFNPDLSQLSYSTFFPAIEPGIGVTPTEIRVIGQRRLWIAGVARLGGLVTTTNAYQGTYGGGTTDGFVSLLDIGQSQLTYSTYIGGQDYDWCSSVVALPDQEVAIGGETYSLDFPSTSDAFDTTHATQGHSVGFLSIIGVQGGLSHSTFLGGTGGDQVELLAKSASGGFIVSGNTASSDFPVTRDGIDTVLNDGNGNTYDGFLCILSHDLSQLDYGTFVGGGNLEYVESQVLDHDETLWLGGRTLSFDFPVTSDAFELHSPSSESDFLMHISLGTMSVAPTHASTIPELTSIQIYPNPSNMLPNILFTLSKRTIVSLKVFDILGRIEQVQSLGLLDAGEHQAAFLQSQLAAGVYFVELKSRTESKTMRLLLIK